MSIHVRKPKGSKGKSSKHAHAVNVASRTRTINKKASKKADKEIAKRSLGAKILSPFGGEVKAKHALKAFAKTQKLKSRKFRGITLFKGK